MSAVVKESRNSPTTITAEPMIGKSRTWPVREMTRPELIEAAIIPATIGSIRMPAFVGLAPCTICM